MSFFFNKKLRFFVKAIEPLTRKAMIPYNRR